MGVGGGSWGHERPETLRCASGKPRMAENRYSGPEHWPRQRRREIGTRLPLMEGAAPQGRCFAIGSRPEAAPIASGHVLGDGSEGRAKESSKKTYEIFFRATRACGARDPTDRDACTEKCAHGLRAVGCQQHASLGGSSAHRRSRSVYGGGVNKVEDSVFCTRR